VEIDRSTQARVRLNPATVRQYVELLERKIEFKDDIEVYYEGFVYWVGDGFHRLAAYREVGRARVPALVREGAVREAMIHAAGANSEHGLPRKREDVQCAIDLLLDDDVVGRYSSRMIAKIVRCAPSTVEARRKERGLVVYTDKHGNETEIDVSGQKGRARDNPLIGFKDMPDTMRGITRQLIQELKAFPTARMYSWMRDWYIHMLPVHQKGLDKLQRDVDGLMAGYETGKDRGDEDEDRDDEAE
jgi:hypothetical protein